MHGIYVKLTHTGVSNSGLLLQDIPTTASFTAFRRPGPVYVPVNATVEIAYTGEVATSFESGTIRGFIDLGYLTAEIMFGDGVYGFRTWSGPVPNTGVATELFIGGLSGQRFVLKDNSLWQFEVRVAAIDTGDSTQCAWWDLTGGINRAVGAATTTLVGANIGFTQNSGGNSAGWIINVAADATNGALSIKGTVPASVGDVKFVASGNLTLVTL